MNSAEAYLENMKVKKTAFGGFDKEAVYSTMQELSSIYQKELLQLKAEKESLEATLQRTSSELESANQQIQLLTVQLEEYKARRNEYDTSISTFTQAVHAVTAGKEKIIEEANQRAEEILTKANEEMEAIRREEISIKKQNELEAARMSKTRQQFDSSMDKLRRGLTEMLGMLDDLHGETADYTSGEDEIQQETDSVPCLESVWSEECSGCNEVYLQA